MKYLSIVAIFSFAAWAFAGSGMHDDIKNHVPSAKMADSLWITDYKEALKQSEKTGKPVLMNFTGSDWCIYCIILDKNVFAKKEFKAYAKDNLILLELDYPNDPQKKVSDELEMLAQMYRVQGFPTLYLTDAKGRVFAQPQFQEISAAEYVEYLKGMVAQYKKWSTRKGSTCKTVSPFDRFL